MPKDTTLKTRLESAFAREIDEAAARWYGGSSSALLRESAAFLMVFRSTIGENDWRLLTAHAMFKDRGPGALAAQIVRDALEAKPAP